MDAAIANIVALLLFILLTSSSSYNYYSASGASLSRDRLCGTVFRLLYRDRRWHCTLSSDKSGLSVPYLMCRRTAETSTTAWHCCGVFRDSGKGGFAVNTSLRCSGMARVLKGSYSFTCTLCVHPLME